MPEACPGAVQQGRHRASPAVGRHAGINRLFFFREGGRLSPEIEVCLPMPAQRKIEKGRHAHTIMGVLLPLGR